MELQNPAPPPGRVKETPPRRVLVCDPSQLAKVFISETNWMTFFNEREGLREA